MQTIQTTEIKVRKSVKASKFTEGQKAFILKQGEEGTPIGEICRKGDQPAGLLQLKEKIRRAAAG